MTASAPAKNIDWLKEVRADAWRRFEETPAPLNTVETWRRMPFKSWELDTLTSGDCPDISGTAGAASGGAELMTLEEAARKRAEVVEPTLVLSAASDFRKLEAANLALWRGGAFLRVPQGVKVEAPVRITFRHDPARAFAFPRVEVVVEDGGSVTIVEEHLGLPGPAGGAPKSAAFSRVRIGKGAGVRLFYTQDLNEDAVHFWSQRVEMAEDSRLEHYSIMLGARRHKSELEVLLHGRGARSDIRGVLLGRKGQFYDPHTRQMHRAPKTASDLLFRTALRDDARSIYTGLIRIERNAPDCEAYQSNRNLLLSDTARADSTPILEILPDAVRCRHGSTAGPLNPDELFYLRTRGLPKADALEMLIMGFFDPILSRLPVEELRERLSGKVRGGVI